MKTTKTISMAEFAEAVEKIANKNNPTYYTVSAEIGKHASGKSEIGFRAYISGFGFFDGKTPNECLTKILNSVNPKKSIIKDIVV